MESSVDGDVDIRDSISREKEKIFRMKCNNKSNYRDFVDAFDFLIDVDNEDLKRKLWSDLANKINEKSFFLQNFDEFKTFRDLNNRFPELVDRTIANSGLALNCSNAVKEYSDLSKMWNFILELDLDENTKDQSRKKLLLLREKFESRNGADAQGVKEEEAKFALLEKAQNSLSSLAEFVGALQKSQSRGVEWRTAIIRRLKQKTVLDGISDYFKQVLLFVNSLPEGSSEEKAKKEDVYNDFFRHVLEDGAKRGHWVENFDSILNVIHSLYGSKSVKKINESLVKHIVHCIKSADDFGKMVEIVEKSQRPGEEKSAFLSIVVQVVPCIKTADDLGILMKTLAPFNCHIFKNQFYCELKGRIKGLIKTMDDFETVARVFKTYLSAEDTCARGLYDEWAETIEYIAKEAQSFSKMACLVKDFPPKGGLRCYALQKLIRVLRKDSSDARKNQDLDVVKIFGSFQEFLELKEVLKYLDFLAADFSHQKDMYDEFLFHFLNFDDLNKKDDFYSQGMGNILNIFGSEYDGERMKKLCGLLVAHLKQNIKSADDFGKMVEVIEKSQIPVEQKRAFLSIVTQVAPSITTVDDFENVLIKTTSFLDEDLKKEAYSQLKNRLNFCIKTFDDFERVVAIVDLYFGEQVDVRGNFYTECARAIKNIKKIKEKDFLDILERFKVEKAGKALLESMGVLANPSSRLRTKKVFEAVARSLESLESAADRESAEKILTDWIKKFENSDFQLIERTIDCFSERGKKKVKEATLWAKTRDLFDDERETRKAKKQEMKIKTDWDWMDAMTTGEGTVNVDALLSEVAAKSMAKQTTAWIDQIQNNEPNVDALLSGMTEQTQECFEKKPGEIFGGWDNLDEDLDEGLKGLLKTPNEEKDLLEKVKLEEELADINGVEYCPFQDRPSQKQSRGYEGVDSKPYGL